MAQERYNAPEREKHWQRIWDEQKTFLTASAQAKPKYYVLEMFPYCRGASMWATSAIMLWAQLAASVRLGRLRPAFASGPDGDRLSS